MARPESWQLDPASYPVSLVTQTRFQDIDPNRHLNNVAFATMFENARVRFNRALRPWADRPKNERSMVAAVTINYLREGSYPDDVEIASGVSKIGTSSYVIAQAMFQHGHCIATCDSVIVCRTDGEGKPLRQAVVEELEKMRTKN
ncbi:acyl-CoA thioester hydrolase [Parasphingorhabdus marina DSM 22363]|uniref:Acyl-CoA thioester hydrolase n=1 Tax=Parasphingorhabdus marina DSM 22363 TaxID=1123272 RepID=A0A1N6CLX0_9SPHN|nr:acyl-CoA thioesterase [Parasphingorhabdus marina]SIN59479.1 acyl-CoA thioester hydrolase [Parasphingorhabdus marina DSM 22363]